MKINKIILATELSEPWHSGLYYKTGFEKNGITVLPFNTNSSSPDEIILLTKRSKADVIVYTKDELPVEIFQELKRYSKVVQWYPDPIIPDWLIPYVKIADIFFTMSEGLVDEFKKYNPNVFWLTQAFEPSHFIVKNITPEDKKKYSSDVTFIGTLGSSERYLIRRKILKTILRENIHLKWWGPRLPRKLSTLPLILGRLGRSYGGKFVWGEEHAKIARLSKIYLGIDSQPHIRKSMSERMYIAVGCGAFYMCQYVDGIEEVLEPDKEIVTFRDEDEMIDKIKFYLKNDALREKIARAGQERVLREHTYEVRIRQMISIIERLL